MYTVYVHIIFFYHELWNYCFKNRKWELNSDVDLKVHDSTKFPQIVNDKNTKFIISLGLLFISWALKKNLMKTQEIRKFELLTISIDKDKVVWNSIKKSGSQKVQWTTPIFLILVFTLNSIDCIHFLIIKLYRFVYCSILLLVFRKKCLSEYIRVIYFVLQSFARVFS